MLHVLYNIHLSKILPSTLYFLFPKRSNVELNLPADEQAAETWLLYYPINFTTSIEGNVIIEYLLRKSYQIS